MFQKLGKLLRCNLRECGFHSHELPRTSELT
jgi:hypothetical protein